jgi:hypothetical protein
VNRHTVPHYGYAAEYRKRHDATERESPLAPRSRADYNSGVVARALVRYLVGGFLISFGTALVGKPSSQPRAPARGGSVNCESPPIHQADLARFLGVRRGPLRGPGTPCPAQYERWAT